MSQSLRLRESGTVRRDSEVPDAIVGAAAIVTEQLIGAGRLVGRVAGPGVRFVLEPPLVPIAWRPARAVEAVVRRGRAERLAARVTLEEAVAVLVPALVARLVELVQVTDLVKQSVDLDALMTDVDLDAIAARIDIEKIIGRVDLVTLAQDVITAIDLPEIIRQSSGSMASETVRGVRMQGIEADRAVGRVVERLLSRRRARKEPQAGAAP